MANAVSSFVEDLAEYHLHYLDVLADAELAAEFALDVRRR